MEGGPSRDPRRTLEGLSEDSHAYASCASCPSLPQGIFLIVVWIRPIHKVASFLLPIGAAALSMVAFTLQIMALQSEFGFLPGDCKGGPGCAVDVLFTWALAALSLVAFLYYACAPRAALAVVEDLRPLPAPDPPAPPHAPFSSPRSSLQTACCSLATSSFRGVRASLSLPL